MIDILLTSEEASREARRAGEAIDRRIAGEEPCPTCGSPMHYESIRTPTSYRAFAVCDDPECGERIEF